MRTRRGRLLERHWLRLFCQVAAKVFFLFYFKKKLQKRHLLRGCFVRSLQRSYICVYILKKQTQKYHNIGGGVKLRPPSYVSIVKKKQRWGCQITPCKSCSQCTMRYSVVASPLRPTRSYHR